MKAGVFAHRTADQICQFPFKPPAVFVRTGRFVKQAGVVHPDRVRGDDGSAERGRCLQRAGRSNSYDVQPWKIGFARSRRKIDLVQGDQFIQHDLKGRGAHPGGRDGGFERGDDRGPIASDLRGPGYRDQPPVLVFELQIAQQGGADEFGAAGVSHQQDVGRDLLRFDLQVVDSSGINRQVGFRVRRGGVAGADFGTQLVSHENPPCHKKMATSCGTKQRPACSPPQIP